MLHYVLNGVKDGNACKAQDGSRDFYRLHFTGGVGVYPAGAAGICGDLVIPAGRVVYLCLRSLAFYLHGGWKKHRPGYIAAIRRV